MATSHGRLSFNTQPPEGGWPNVHEFFEPDLCFNTQPPEGGWDRFIHTLAAKACFNTQPPEGGWVVDRPVVDVVRRVSTRSRPKAAG